MDKLEALWKSLSTGLAVQFSGFGISDLLDILIVAVIIYKVIDFIRESRAAQLIKGMLLLVVVMQLSDLFNMDTTNFLLRNTLQVGVLAVVVLFQPELRRALEQVGRSRIGLDFVNDSSSSDTERRRVIDEVCIACDHLSQARTGALIVFERTTNLTDVMQSGVRLDAVVTKELVESIFYEGNPLHDGAVFISKNRLTAAACLLPLTANRNLSKELGTRHRAAIGMSENSDALVVVVSEETGKISVVTDGHIRRGYQLESLRDALIDTFLQKEEDKASMLGRFFKKGGSVNK